MRYCNCLECDELFNEEDVRVEDGICDKCSDLLFEQEEKRKKRVKSAMKKVDELINAFTGV